MGSTKNNNQIRKPFGKGEILGDATPEKPSSLSKCLNKVKHKIQDKNALAEIWNEWTNLLGEPLSSNCQPISLYKGILFIGATHPQWLQALQYNKTQLLASLRASGKQIKEIRIQRHHKSIIRKETLNEKTIWDNHPSRIDIHGLQQCNCCGSPAPGGEIALWGECSFCRRINLSK